MISPQGGEAEALTSVEDGVGGFAWSPDGRTIAYKATDAKSAAVKDREKKYGEFQVVEQDHRMTHLFTIDVATRVTKALTTGAFTVGSFAWSPDGKSIAFDHRINPELKNGGTADISIVTVADGSIRKLVTQDGPDAHPVWSPDGSRIAFETADGEPGLLLREQPDRDRPGGRRHAHGAVGRRSTRTRRSSTGSRAASTSPRPRARTRISTRSIRGRRRSRRSRPSIRR